jgi:microcystin-dependent protein
VPSPIVPNDFGEAIPSANADFCDRFTKFLSIPQKLRDLFSWMLTDAGEPSLEFKQEIATFSAPTGTIIYCLTQNVGDGWLLADGREVSRTEYASLFNAIGTRFGDGNATTTFTLPDLRGRSLIGAGAGAANADFGTTALTSREINQCYVGEEAHALTEAENGEHMHRSGMLVRLSLTPTNTSAILRDQTDKSLSLYGSTASTVGLGKILQSSEDSTSDRDEINVGPSGDGSPHQTVHPCVISYAFIKT